MPAPDVRRGLAGAQSFSLLKIMLPGLLSLAHHLILCCQRASYLFIERLMRLLAVSTSACPHIGSAVQRLLITLQTEAS